MHSVNPPSHDNMPSTTRTVRSARPTPAALAAVLALAGIASLPVAAQTAEPPAAPAAASAARPHAYSIPPGPLAGALQQFASQSGRIVRDPERLAADLHSLGVQATLPATEALAHLLAGSGVQALPAADGSFTLARTAGAAGSSLPAVQVTASGGNTSEGRDSYVPEATSTATGLNLSLRETPQSVTVVTRQRIEDQAMATIGDALRSTVGVSIKPFDSARTSLTARGFDIDNFLIDGLPVVAGNIGYDAENTDIYDRIEIVRGATGLISGAGTPAASINLVRKHAESRVFTGTASVTAGSRGHAGASVDLSMPLNESGTVRGRVVASAARQNGFVPNERERSGLLYGVIDADLTPRTRLSIGFSDERTWRRGTMWSGWPFYFSDGTRTAFDRRRSTGANWNRWDTHQQSAFVNLRHEFGNGWKFTGDVQFRKQNEDAPQLWPYGDPPDRITGLGQMGTLYHYKLSSYQTQGNVQAGGPFELFGRRHQATVGLTHAVSRSGWDNADVLDPDFEMPSIYQWNGVFPRQRLGPHYVASRGATVQTAVYGAMQLKLTDALTVLPGLRVSRYKQEDFPAVWTREYSRYGDNSVVTPYLGVLYDFTPQLTGYASYTESFKPQSNKDREGHFLKPVTGKAYELGLKGELLDGRLIASGALFEIHQENLAVPDVGHFVPGTSTIASRAASGVKSRGYELELAGQLTPQLEISAGWTQFSARDAEGADVAVDHPRKQLRLFAKYRFDGSLSGLILGGGVNWDGTQPARVANPVTGIEEHVGQRAYALAELMARYEFSPKVAVQLNITNLFDKVYRNTSFWPAYLYGEPRRLTLRADVKF